MLTNSIKFYFALIFPLMLASNVGINCLLFMVAEKNGSLQFMVSSARKITICLVHVSLYSIFQNSRYLFLTKLKGMHEHSDDRSNLLKEQFNQLTKRMEFTFKSYSRMSIVFNRKSNYGPTFTFTWNMFIRWHIYLPHCI